jgi:hypothetical protein
MYTSYILRIAQERLSVAAYEAEQTRLDWKRMKANADAKLYNLEVNFIVLDINDKTYLESYYNTE